MAKTNTEKPSGKAELKSQVVAGTPKNKDAVKTPIQEKKEDVKKDVPKKEETKKPIVKKDIVKKDHAIVNAQSVHVSTKYAIAICKFIKRKTIESAIADLEQVIVKKKAVPMRGEIPHRKGKGMMSGRFPKRASEHFIVLLKGLKGNSIMNGLENPVIVEASANYAQRPFGRGGIHRKRTHIKLRVMDKKEKIVNTLKGTRKKKKMEEKK